MTADKLQALLDSHAAALSEHLGAVQIVASSVMPDGSTQGWRAGNGDWYARRALCQEFVELDQAELLSRRLNPPDEGDAWKAE